MPARESLHLLEQERSEVSLSSEAPIDTDEPNSDGAPLDKYHIPPPNVESATQRELDTIIDSEALAAELLQWHQQLLNTDSDKLSKLDPYAVQQYVIDYLNKRLPGVTSEGFITPELNRSIEIFITEYIRAVKDKISTTEGTKLGGLMEQIRQTQNLYFNGSPSLLTYIGGADAMVRVTAEILDIPELSRMKGNLIAELTYQLSYDQLEADFSALFIGKSNVEVINIMCVLREIGYDSVDNDPWSGPSLDQIINTIGEESNKRSPLVKLFAMNIVKDLELKNVAYNEDFASDEEEAQIDEHAQTSDWHRQKLYGKSAQLKTLTHWNEVNGDLELVRLSKDAVATSVGDFVPYKVAFITQTVPETEELELASIQTMERALVSKEANPLRGESNDVDTSVLLLKRLNEPDMRRVIQASLGINLEEVTLKAQIQLLNFTLNADQEIFDHLQQVLATEPGSKEQFLESFLALEMGDEFGGALLTIREKLPPEQSQEILTQISLFRQHAQELSADFNIVEPNNQTQRAIHLSLVKRMTEALAVVEALSLGQGAEATLYDGQLVSIGSVEAVISTMSLLNKALSKIHQALSSSAEGVMERPESTSLWFDSGTVLMQLREYGSLFEDRDQAREYDGEARINLLVNSESSHKIPEEIEHPVRQRAISIRLDREGLIRDAEGNLVKDEQGKFMSNPTADLLPVSLDIGSIYGDEDDPNVMIGRLLAIGNALITQRRGQKPNYNHVREAFDSQFGLKEPFAHRVRGMKGRYWPLAPEQVRHAA